MCFVAGEVQRLAGGVDHEIPPDDVVDVAIAVVVDSVAVDLAEIGVDGASEGWVGVVNPAVENGHFDALRLAFVAE